MHLPRKYFVAGLLICFGMSSAQGVTINRNRTVDANSSGSESPFFTKSADNLNSLTPALPTSGTAFSWAPEVPTQAGAVTETSPVGAFTIAGTATSAGSWADGNGIPTGLTLNFKAKFTISVTAGNFLTLTTNDPANFGNGLGVTQSAAGVSQMDANEVLTVSAFSISDVGFSGIMAESGFTVGTPTVSTLSTRVFRSAGFNTAGVTTETALLTAGTDTITFGPAAPPGSIASNIPIGNNFNNTFPAQAGPYTFGLTAGAMGLKGIGFAYSTAYDINADVVADNADFDDDDDVDGADFLIWQENLGLASDATRAQGNANPTVDGDVDGADLDVWTAQFGTTPPAISVATAVPEPAAAALSAFAILSALAVRKRN